MGGTPVINPSDAIDQLSQAGAALNLPASQPAPTVDQSSDQTIQPQAAPDAMPIDPRTDPELVGAAVHHGRLASTVNHVVDVLGNVLGGPTTVHVTPQKDGSVTVTHDPSSSGEKWSRVAQAALGGLAKGFAAGPGPGGIARAAAGGIDAGMQLPQQQEDQATNDAKQQNEATQTAIQNKANNALTQQKMYMNMLTSNQLKTGIDEHSSDLMNQYRDGLASSPNSKDFGVISNVDDLQKVYSSNPDFFKSHTDLSLKVAAVPKPGGGTELHAIATDPGDDERPIGKGVMAYTINVDPKTHEPTLDSKEASPGQKTGKLRIANQAQITQYLGMRNAWEKANKGPTTPTELAAAAQTEPDPVKRAQDKAALDSMQNTPLIQAEIAQRRAAAGESAAAARQHNAQTNLLSGAGGGGAAAGGAGTPTGEDYLKTAVDPAMWSRIRATAAGDLKPPTQSRSPANAAFLNAVQNFDPTYTQARYDTVQKFKTGADAANLTSLSTALEHVERASSNSAKLGNSTSLFTGKNLSGDASAYNQDLNLFTEEAGKLVKGGVIGEHEFNALRQGMQSPIQSIRDSAIRETVNLLGGRVSATMQKYKTGSGNDLPVEKYFDQNTQQRLKRYSIAQPAAPGAAAPTAAGPATAGTTFQPMTPPANEPVQPGKHYGLGPKGLGWYR